MLVEISTDLARNGLILRGGFAFAEDEEAPLAALAVLLVGHGGPSLWPHFQAWHARQPADVANPLDTWSRQVIGSVAERFDARAVSPSDRPYLPFQQWAMRAEGMKPSPLGILMHPEFGLWHAYRGALLFDDPGVTQELRALNQVARNPIHLCDICPGKPCKRACPIGAHAGEAFEYRACLDYVRSPSGGVQRAAGCLDRNACPYGAAYRYPAEQQAFHMRAFSRG